MCVISACLAEKSVKAIVTNEPVDAESGPELKSRRSSQGDRLSLGRQMSHLGLTPLLAAAEALTSLLLMFSGFSPLTFESFPEDGPSHSPKFVPFTGKWGQSLYQSLENPETVHTLLTKVMLELPLNSVQRSKAAFALGAYRLQKVSSTAISMQRARFTAHNDLVESERLLFEALWVLKLSPASADGFPVAISALGEAVLLRFGEALSALGKVGTSALRLFITAQYTYCVAAYEGCIMCRKLLTHQVHHDLNRRFGCTPRDATVTTAESLDSRLRTVTRRPVLCTM